MARASVSKTEGWGFETLQTCHKSKVNKVSFFAKVKKFLLEVREEMGRVTWPTRDDIINSTMVVLFAVLVFAVFLGVVDFVLTWAHKILLSGFSL